MRELVRTRRRCRRAVLRERLRGWGVKGRDADGGTSARSPEQPWLSSSSTLGVAAVVVVAAVIRTTAQIIADISAGRSPFYGPGTDAGTIAFGVGLLAAGTLLPLALARRWGRVWPRWFPRLAGRAVPRWLVIAPTGLLAGGMTLIFGLSMIQFLLDPRGSTASSDYPLTFWWFVLPAYLVWGLGLLVLVVAYWSHTPSSRTDLAFTPSAPPWDPPNAECEPATWTRAAARQTRPIRSSGR